MRPGCLSPAAAFLTSASQKGEWREGGLPGKTADSAEDQPSCGGCEARDGEGESGEVRSDGARSGGHLRGVCLCPE